MSKKRSGFNRILFFYVLVIVIVPVLLIGFLNYGIFNQYSYRQIISHNKLAANEIARNVNNILRIVGNEIESVSIIVAGRNTERSRQYVSSRIYNLHGFFDMVLYYNSEGKLMYSYPEMPDFYGFDYSKKIFLNDADYYADGVWSDIDFSEFTGFPAIRYTVPLIAGGKKEGYVSGLINISKLLKKATTLDITGSQLKVVITDYKNIILFHPDSQRAEGMDTLYIRDRYADSGYIDGVKNIIVDSSVPLTKWKVFVLEPFSHAFRHLILLRLILILIILICVCIAVLSLYLGYKRVFLPIRVMTLFTAKVSRGSYAIPEYDFNINEIRMLYENFLRMVRKIMQRENTIRESELKYRNLVEENLDSIFKLDNSLKISYVSPSIENLLGYTQDEFISLINTLHGPNKILPERRQNIKALKTIRDTFIRESIQPAFNLTVLHKNGSYIIIEVQAAPVKNPNGLVYEIQSTARDITRRYEAERKADYFKNYLFNIIDSMSSLVLTISDENKIDQFNNAALEFFDLKAKELKNKSIFELSGSFKDYGKYFEIVRSTGTPMDLSDTLIRKNKPIECKVSLFPLRSSKHYLVMRLDDVSRITATERQLRQAQKFRSLGNLAEGLAHDFNNILGALSGTVNLMQYKIQNNLTDTFDEDIGILKEIVTKGNSVIKQLTSISKPSNSRFVPCDINQIVDSAVKDLVLPEKRKDIRINFNPYAASAYILGDFDALKEMFLNILHNSIDLIKDDGDIRIGIRRITDKNESTYQHHIDAYFQISITDSASFASKEDIDNIFDPYYKNKLTGRKQGIALSVAYNIAKSHNGFIDVYADNISGTAYTIYLPLINQKEERKKDSRSSHEAKLYKGEGLILLVDDESVVRYTSRRMLEICGYKVIEAGNGREALRSYQENSGEISCVILDYFMPDMNGFQVFQEIQKLSKNVKVVLSSGSKNNVKIEEAMKSGIHEFLLKPYSLEELSETVHKVIQR